MIEFNFGLFFVFEACILTHGTALPVFALGGNAPR